MCWWDRHPDFYEKYIVTPHNINFLADLSPKSGASAISCSQQTPAVAWLGRTFNASHATFIQSNIDNKMLAVLAKENEDLKVNIDRVFPDLLKVPKAVKCEEDTDSSAADDENEHERGEGED